MTRLSPEIEEIVRRDIGSKIQVFKDNVPVDDFGNGFESVSITDLGVLNTAMQLFARESFGVDFDSYGFGGGLIHDDSFILITNHLNNLSDKILLGKAVSIGESVVKIESFQGKVTWNSSVGYPLKDDDEGLFIHLDIPLQVRVYKFSKSEEEGLSLGGLFVGEGASKDLSEPIFESINKETLTQNKFQESLDDAPKKANIIERVYSAEVEFIRRAVDYYQSALLGDAQYALNKREKEDLKDFKKKVIEKVVSNKGM